MRGFRNVGKPRHPLLLFALAGAGVVAGCNSGGGGGSGGAAPAAAIQFATGGFDDNVEAVAPTAGGAGAVWFAGRFLDYSGSSAPRIARVFADGTLDPSFSPGAGFDWQVNALCLAPDGSGDVIVGGSFTSYDGAPAGGIIRLDPDGGVDPSLATGAGFDGAVQAIVAAGDGTGDLYVVGSFASYDGTAAPGIVRLGANGALVPGFDAGSGFTGGAREIALATDGSGDLFVGGPFTHYDGVPSKSYVRLRANGSLTPGFSIGTGFNSTVLALAAVGDGSGDVIVGGSFTTLDGASAPRIVRLAANGSVAGTFSVGVGFDFPVHDIVEAADGSGELWVAGAFRQYSGAPAPGIIRLSPTGAVAAGFSPGEGFERGSPLALARVADGSGDIFVGGSFTSLDGRCANRAVRIEADGSIDPSFAVVGGFDARVDSLAWSADGSGFFAAGGFVGHGEFRSPGIIRFDAQSAIDPGFDAGDGFDGGVNAIAPANDGSGDIFAIGSFSSYDGVPAARLARLSADGGLAPGFSIGAGFGAPPIPFAILSAIAPAEDGSGDIYVGGAFEEFDGVSSPGIVRLDADGSLDPGFSVGSGLDGWVWEIALAADGSGDLYVAGAFDDFDGASAGGIVRLDSDGARDPAFSTGTGFDSLVTSVAVATDGSGAVYAGGIFSSYDGVAVPCAVRLTASGALDPGFVLPASLDGECQAIVPSTDGTGDVFFVLAHAGGDSYGIVRLDPSGAVVPSFGVGSGSNGFVASIARAPDGSGRLLVGGTFTAWNGARHDFAVCLGPDGAPE